MSTTNLDDQLLLDVEIYPNPASDFIIVDSKDNEVADSYVIFSPDGSKILIGDIEIEKQRIDISHLPHGAYIIELMKNGRQKSLAFVKEE